MQRTCSIELSGPRLMSDVPRYLGNTLTPLLGGFRPQFVNLSWKHDPFTAQSTNYAIAEFIRKQSPNTELVLTLPARRFTTHAMVRETLAVASALSLRKFLVVSGDVRSGDLGGDVPFPHATDLLCYLSTAQFTTSIDTLMCGARPEGDVCDASSVVRRQVWLLRLKKECGVTSAISQLGLTKEMSSFNALKSELVQSDGSDLLPLLRSVVLPLRTSRMIRTLVDLVGVDVDADLAKALATTGSEGGGEDDAVIRAQHGVAAEQLARYWPSSGRLGNDEGGKRDQHSNHIHLFAIPGTDVAASLKLLL